MSVASGRMPVAGFVDLVTEVFFVDPLSTRIDAQAGISSRNPFEGHLWFHREKHRRKTTGTVFTCVL